MSGGRKGHARCMNKKQRMHAECMNKEKGGGNVLGQGWRKKQAEKWGKQGIFGTEHEYGREN